MCYWYWYCSWFKIGNEVYNNDNMVANQSIQPSTTCALVVIQGKVQYGYCCDETIKAMIFLTTRVDYDVFEATEFKSRILFRIVVQHRSPYSLIPNKLR